MRQVFSNFARGTGEAPQPSCGEQDRGEEARGWRRKEARGKERMGEE